MTDYDRFLFYYPQKSQKKLKYKQEFLKGENDG